MKTANSLTLVALFCLLPLLARAADLNVAWKNPTTFADGTAMAATEITGSSISCGLTQTNLTLFATTTGAATTATVSGALSGKSYVCGVATNSKNNGSSAMAFSSSATVPLPAPSPPSGVTLTVAATNTTAYKLRQSVDGLSFVAIGTLPAGVSCDPTHSVDGYNLVPRGTVKLSSRFDTLPLVVFAQCS